MCARLDTPRVPKPEQVLAPLTYIAADSHQLSKTEAVLRPLANQVLSQLSYRP